MLKYKTIGIKKYGKTFKALKKRKIQGERCDCWDSVLQRSTDDEGALCHGTGIKTTGGYYEPIEFKAAINFRPNENQVTPFGV